MSISHTWLKINYYENELGIEAAIGNLQIRIVNRCKTTIKVNTVNRCNISNTKKLILKLIWLAKTDSGEKKRNNLQNKEITFFHIKINRSSKFKDFQIPTNMIKKNCLF